MGMLMADTELELVRAAQGGDSQAVEALLVRHERQVYRFGLRLCGSEDVAKEVLQQTLLTAFKGMRGFRGDAALSTWLFQIARSHCIKERRRQSDAVSLEEPGVLSVESHGADPEAVAHAKQLGEALQAAIRALPENAREVLILRDVEGLSAEQAAQVVGIEVRALKSRLHRARLQMRRHLSEILEPAGG